MIKFKELEIAIQPYLISAAKVATKWLFYWQ